MCNSYNSNYTDKYQRNFAEISQKRQAKKAKTAAIIAGVATLATSAITIAPSIFSFIATYCSNNETTGTKSVKANEFENVDVISNEEAKQEVIKLLKEDKFNNLDEDTQTQVIAKYTAIKSYSTNNNISISDEEMTLRLTTYIKALKAHEQELKMGEHVIKGGLPNEYNGGSIVDEDVELQQRTGSDDEYRQALLNRGIGSIQLYDTNGDNVVYFEEFIEKEADDWKLLTNEDITDDMKEESKKMFNLIDKNNDGKINSIEFATYQYARATLDDSNENSNSELSFSEWYSAQSITENNKLKKRYNYAVKQVYGFLQGNNK